MGNAVVLGIFGEDVLFDYMIFTLPLCLYVYSFGTASLIPKSKENSKEATHPGRPILLHYFHRYTLHS